MVTIAAAIIAAIEANWAIGGDPPEFLNSEIDLYPSTANVESIYVMGYTLKTAIDPKTLKRANKTHYIQLLINTSDQTNRESRLNDLVEEAERIINTTGNVTGYSSVKVTDIDRTVTLKEQHVYRALMTVRLLETMVDSATASGHATSDYHILGDLIVDGLITAGTLVFSAGGAVVGIILDEDDMATDSATALATQQSIKAYADVIQADVDGFHDELKDLTQVEIQQLENINAVTISNAQWGYLGALDQALTQASSPTFVGLTLSGAITGLTDLTLTGAIATATNISMTGELDLTGAVSIDLNPSGTGSQNIIDITPTAALVAGSNWKGLRINSAALDPATGATSYVYGIEIENRFVESVDKNAYIHGVVVRSAPGDTGYSFVDYVTEKTQNKTHSAFYSYFGGVLSVTATYQGIYIDWDGITRDGGAPVLQGARVQLPADYSNFGVSYAGYFSGDGRSVTICDTTYALDISGAVRIVGDVTVDNLITAGNVDGVDVSTFKTAYDAHVAASDLHIAHSGVTIIAGTGLSGGGTIAASRTINCDITQYTDGLARTACLEDDVYGAGWDADVTHAPTQNAVYDKINAMDTLIAANTTVVEVEAVITAELVNGQSIDLAIDALINTHNAADNHIAHSGVTIIAGTGLSGGGTIAATRTINCDITQYTDALAKAACVSDVAYAGTWDGVTDVAPSKNAVYDQIETLSGEFSLAFKTITGITNDVVADAVADTLTLASANNLLTIVGVTATDTITWTIVEGNFVLDGNTVQIDGINSDGGAFAFNTTGDVTFNQSILTNGTLTVGTYTDIRGQYWQLFEPVNDGNPYWQLGSSAANDFYINTVYNSGVQTLDRVVFQSRSSAIGDGKMLFYPDQVLALSLHPTGDADVAGAFTFGGGVALASSTQVRDAGLIGAASWVPCTYMSNSVAEAWDNSNSMLTNPSTTNQYLMWQLPLPPVKQGLKLYVTGVRVGLNAANGTNYVDEMWVYGKTYSGRTYLTVADRTINKTTVALHTYTMADFDCSTYETVAVEFLVALANVGALKISSVSLLCYYST